MDGRPAVHLSVHAVNVFVRDQDRSLRFYLDQLGFSLVADARLESGERWIAVAPPDGSTVLALRAPAAESPDYRLIGRPTGVVFVTEDVVAKYAEWRRRGVRFQYAPRLRRMKYSLQSPDGPAPETAEDRAWGGVFAHFRDPDGNTFALLGFDEINRKIAASRRAAAERMEAERRAAQELEIAKQVQARLFPQVLPAVRTLEYAGSCIQARQVGGDYYDFLDLGEGRFGLVVGDIAGKGIAAALLMANLQANLRIHCAAGLERPRALLRSVNQVFHRNTHESAYATLFFAEYQCDERRLLYANCGHVPALLVRKGGDIKRLEPTGTVLGLFEDWDCAVEEVMLGPGDLLAVYTDGITESFDAQGEEFGEERLIGALLRHRNLAAREAIPAVVGEAQRFCADEQADDMTLALARCR